MRLSCRLLTSAMDDDPRLAEEVLLDPHVECAPLYIHGALRCAASFGHLGVMAVLLEHGADLDSNDAIQFTALHYAILEKLSGPYSWAPIGAKAIELLNWRMFSLKFL